MKKFSTEIEKEKEDRQGSSQNLNISVNHSSTPGVNVQGCTLYIVRTKSKKKKKFISRITEISKKKYKEHMKKRYTLGKSSTSLGLLLLYI